MYEYITRYWNWCLIATAFLTQEQDITNQSLTHDISLIPTQSSSTDPATVTLVKYNMVSENTVFSTIVYVLSISSECS